MGSLEPEALPLSATELQVLLVLCERELYGYAILKAVEEESRGSVSPEIGSLYRILARLVSQGLLEEADPPADAEPHPGQPRRYYGITEKGRRVAATEAARLRGVVELARRRRILPEPG